MRQLFTIAFILLFSVGLFAEGPITKHVVFLKDKNNNPYSCFPHFWKTPPV